MAIFVKFLIINTIYHFYSRKSILKSLFIRLDFNFVKSNFKNKI